MGTICQYIILSNEQYANIGVAGCGPSYQTTFLDLITAILT
jgi:hypothetical protein